jgi:hypothetical protein
MGNQLQHSQQVGGFQELLVSSFFEYYVLKWYSVSTDCCAALIIWLWDSTQNLYVWTVPVLEGMKVGMPCIFLRLTPQRHMTFNSYSVLGTEDI